VSDSPRRVAVAIGLGAVVCIAALVVVKYKRDHARVPAQTQAQTQQPGAIKVNPIDGQPYVWVPPGSFRMGCSPGDGGCAGYDEDPAHAVTITKGFWLGKTPVTQAAYQRVTGQKPSNFDGANLPVETIAWKEADAYCRAIGGRLPTEAEWEFAARAGTTPERYGNLDDIAWYRANSEKTTHEVGQKQPNAFGLYDMIGNVWQWTADWYGIYHPEDPIDPQGPATGKHRSLRGGAFDSDDRDLRVSMRTVLGAPEFPDETIGFRCVAESPAPPPETVVPPPPASAPGPVRLETNPRDGQTYVQISTGSFQMGCSPGDRMCYDDEKPTHTVTITHSFWLGETPVTQAAYQRMTGKNPSKFQGPSLPVDRVTWIEADAYCRAIRGRLPTEAEWEFAARAGTTAERYGTTDDIAWYRDNSDTKTQNVRQKQPNAAGLYDMLGDVKQWTADWYGGVDGYPASALSDPPGPTTGFDKVLRGAHWWSYESGVRASARSRYHPDLSDEYTGFRCVGP
jgi:formylglycine-generating enzyme required for sulfatase activity